MTGRPEWDVYFLLMAQVAASRSTCLRRRVGAVLVRDKQILSTGYNGAPRGVSHCEAVGCLREQLGIASGERHEICRGSHAEINAIAQAAAAGTSTHARAVRLLHEGAHQRRLRNGFLSLSLSRRARARHHGGVGSGKRLGRPRDAAARYFFDSIGRTAGAPDAGEGS